MKLAVDSVEAAVVAIVVLGLWSAARVYRKILDVMWEFRDLVSEHRRLSDEISELERKVARQGETPGVSEPPPDLPPVVETFDYRTTPSSKE